MTDEQRDDLERSVPFELIRATDAPDDGLSLEGYAAVFDSPTRIDSWEGLFDETIVKGAFRRSLNAKTPVLMFEHGRHPLIGSMPLGQIQRAREDAHGLHISARLSDNWLIAPVRDAIADGAIDGMSFRFQVVRDTWDPAPPWELPEGSTTIPSRTLKEIKVVELGPVVFPAYTGTSVGVRDQMQLVELARSLFSGTSPDPSDLDTRDEPAEPEPEPDVPVRIPSIVRRAYAATLIGVS